MGSYITFYRGERRGDYDLFLEERPRYLVQDLPCLIESIVIGASVSASLKGLTDVLDNREGCSQLYTAYGREAIEEAISAIRDLLRAEALL